MSRKEIHKPEWQDRLQSFTSGNRGRSSEIVTKQGTLVEEKPFLSVDFDSEGKGKTLTISVDGYGHRVMNPEEIYIEELDNGEASSFEVIDENGESSFLTFLL